MIPISSIDPCTLWNYYLSLGIALSVIANVVMNSGEAFVKALSDLVNKKFGNVKIAFDVYVLCFPLHYLDIFKWQYHRNTRGNSFNRISHRFCCQFFCIILKQTMLCTLKLSTQ